MTRFNYVLVCHPYFYNNSLKCVIILVSNIVMNNTMINK